MQINYAHIRTYGGAAGGHDVDDDDDESKQNQNTHTQTQMRRRTQSRLDEVRRCCGEVRFLHAFTYARIHAQTHISSLGAFLQSPGITH